MPNFETRRFQDEEQANTRQHNSTATQEHKRETRQDEARQDKSTNKTKHVDFSMFFKGKRLLLRRGVSKTKSKPTQDNTTAQQHKNTNARRDKTKQDKTRGQQKQKKVILASFPKENCYF